MNIHCLLIFIYDMIRCCGILMSTIYPLPCVCILWFYEPFILRAYESMDVGIFLGDFHCLKGTSF